MLINQEQVLQITLKLLSDKFAVCQLPADEEIPEWAVNEVFYSITRTADELSIVCLEKDVPSGIKSERNWRIFKVKGTLDFSLCGIISSISAPLTSAGISIFTVSTYNTDYILVREESLIQTVETLRKSGFIIRMY